MNLNYAISEVTQVDILLDELLNQFTAIEPDMSYEASKAFASVLTVIYKLSEDVKSHRMSDRHIIRRLANINDKMKEWNAYVQENDKKDSI